MKNFLDLVFFPSETIYRMSRRDPGYGGIIVLAAASLSCIVAMGLVIGIPRPVSYFMVTWGVGIRSIVCFIFIFIAAASYHYFAEIIGGRGNPAMTFKGLLYTLAPLCFLVPAALISKAWLGTAAYFFFFFAALFYMAVLQLKLISYFYGLAPGKAIVVLLTPWLVLGALIFSVLIFLSAGLISVVL